MKALLAVVIALVIGIMAYTLLKKPATDGGPPAPKDSVFPMGAILSTGSETPVVLDGRSMRLGVGEITDSRCPKGAQCVRAGEGAVSLRLDPGDGEALEARLLTTDAAPKPLGPLAVRVTDLAPYPEVGTTIDPAAYRVTLEIDVLHGP